MKQRLYERGLLDLQNSQRGRFTVITGARQIGKTTLVEKTFPERPLLRFDSARERDAYGRLSPQDWITRFPTAILDEVQKAPEILETLKSCYDQDSTIQYILLGSSQIMLMHGIRETLAGRVALQKMFALSLPELMSSTEQSITIRPSAFMDLLQKLNTNEPDKGIHAFLAKMCDPLAFTEPHEARAKQAWEYYLQWGGMPVLTHEEMNDNNRMAWLSDYQELYLQRDLADLAKLNDLDAFVNAQKIAALRTSELIQYASLASSCGISPKTAKNYIHYLELSYQVYLLKPWHRNSSKRLSKSSKLHFLDPGVRRGILNRRGTADGQEFESAVVSEFYKQSHSPRAFLDFYHLRTTDGREVDLLLELDQGYIPIECEMTSRNNIKDCRHFRGLEDILDKPVLFGMVINQCQDAFLQEANERIGFPVLFAPAWRVLS